MNVLEKVMLDIPAVMESLSQKRPIFHLESDFQFALAWEIQRFYPEYDVRLEVPFGFEKKGRIDIVVRNSGAVLPIELKYLKKKLLHTIDGEQFNLADGVHDMDMYSCMADIERMESFCGQLPDFDTGYVVWLTNDPAYWDKNYNSSYYKEFHAPDGSVKTGKMYFDKANPRTKKPPQICSLKHYKNAVTLNGSYHINWQDYSDLEVPKGIFKYAVVRIG
ncbi:MAG: hypothetical protein FWH32_01965 [Clostridiales bacterium]|nr:hypothetical protein [Clostridiales bacterium]